MENSCWGKLPEDVHADILSRLRGKNLMKLKLVSWGWYNVISYICIPRLSPPSPEASLCGVIYRDCQGQAQGEDGRSRIRTVYTSKLRISSFSKISKFRVSYNIIEEKLYKNYQPEDIQDCCNGILLMLQHHNDARAHYSLYNPTTGETIHVPPPPPPHIQYCFASLAFDPTKSLHYKIVCTPGANLTNPLKVETFSSEAGKWVGYALNIDSVIDGVEWIHRSAYLDGHIYRLLKTNYLACIDAKRSEHSRVQAIELPTFRGEIIYIDENSCYGFIGISRQRLHYSARDRSGSTMLVYMLKDDGSWLPKHTIPIDDLLANPTNYFFAKLKRIVNTYRKETWFNFYGFHPNCDTLFLITPNAMICYSPEKKLELFHIEGGEKDIVVGQNYGFPFSHCPIRLRNTFRKTCACFDQHLPQWKSGEEKQCPLD